MFPLKKKSAKQVKAIKAKSKKKKSAPAPFAAKVGAMMMKA